MKTRNYFLVLIALFAGLSFANAQKIVLLSGKVPSLKGEEKVNVEYDYSSFGVGKYSTEAAYVKDKIEEHNKKEPGKGDLWYENWVGARKGRYEPKFEELINKETGAKPSFGAYPDAKYTLKVKVTFIEPGFNVGVMKKPSYVSFEYTYFETANPSNVLSKQTQNNVVGSQVMGYDFDAGSRIAESFAKAGKTMGKLVAK